MISGREKYSGSLRSPLVGKAISWTRLGDFIENMAASNLWPRKIWRLSPLDAGWQGDLMDEARRFHGKSGGEQFVASKNMAAREAI
jgi:hypothetical protein